MVRKLKKNVQFHLDFITLQQINDTKKSSSVLSPSLTAKQESAHVSWCSHEETPTSTNKYINNIIYHHSNMGTPPKLHAYIPNRRFKGFTLAITPRSSPRSKMERFTPTIFIEACHKITVLVNLKTHKALFHYLSKPTISTKIVKQIIYQ